MVGVQEAAILSTQLAQEGMPLTSWAGLMRQFDKILDGQDHAVGRAASTGHLFGVGDEGAPPFVVELDSTRAGEPTAGDHRVIRLAVLQATRAAQRGAEHVEKLVLSGVEREFLQPPRSESSVELVLRGWTRAVSGAAQALTPSDALTISITQQALLHRGVELLGQHEVVDGVGHERLRCAVETSSATWDHAYRVWRGMAPKRPESAGELSKAMVALHLAMRIAPSGDVLTALMRTGFGGNLVSALAVTPPALRQDSELVEAAVILEPRSDVATTFRATPQNFQPESTHPAGDMTVHSSAEKPVPPPQHSEPPPEMKAAEVAVVIDAGPPVSLTDVAELSRLARVRDAGVAASAALTGVSEARSLLPANVTVRELEALVERGASARSAIVEAGMPMVNHWGRRVVTQLRDDYLQNAAVALIESAGRWTPEKASWSTYSYQTARYAFFQELRAVKKRAEIATEFVDWKHFPDSSLVSTPPPSPEDVAVTRVERQELAAMLERIPADLRQVVTTRMGFGSDGPATLAQLADSVNGSPSTAARRVNQALEGLRNLAPSGEGQTVAPPDLRQLTVALRHHRPTGVPTRPRDHPPSTRGAAVTP